MAILAVEPLKTVFNKVIVDNDMAAQPVDSNAFLDWAMEAIELIGGLNRIPNNQYLALKQRTDAVPPVPPNDELQNMAFKIIDGRVLFPKAVINITEVRYYKLDPKDREDYVQATLTVNGALDHTDTNVYFDYIHYIDKGQMACGLIFNRMDGYALCLGLKNPMFYSATGKEINIFIPSLTSYKEAIYWYITKKLIWRDVLRGRNKTTQLTYASSMWENTRKCAYGELMMPDTWETEQLAAELSLGIAYTGLNPRLYKMLSGDSLNLSVMYVGTDKTEPKHV